MQLLDCVLNDSLQKPFSRPPPAHATRNISSNRQTGSDSMETADDSSSNNNDFVLPLLNKTQVTANLSIKFKHLRLEVDKERIVTQL